MKIVTITTIVISFIFLQSCNRTDFSNPEDVLKNYRLLTIENKNIKLYEDFISSRSKEFVTSDEFIKTRNMPDSLLKSNKHLESKIFSYPIDVNNPSFRRFKVDEKIIAKKDTLYNRYYYSLINENGKWKVIWTSSLFSFATKKYSDGNYSEARKTLNKIIEIDPFSGTTYSFLAWCFYRDNSLNRNEWGEGILKNAKYAIAIEEDNYQHYNTLATYYLSIGNTDLEIQSLERGLQYCINNNEKYVFYNNLAGIYIRNNKFKKAENYIKNSLAIDSNAAYIWFTYGNLMQAQNKNNKAIEYFEKALKQKKMENSIQKSLFYSYAVSCFNQSKCKVAKEYINKALDIEPNNNDYQNLYYQIKNCDAKSK